MRKELLDLEENYELELNRIIREIKKNKAEKVLLQLPDAFKPKIKFNFGWSATFTSVILRKFVRLIFSIGILERE